MSEIKPLGGWDYEDHPLVIWANKLDDRYLIEVVADEDNSYKASLRVFDKNEGFKLLLDESTSLSYGAVFGPDVADTEDWKRRTVELVDGAPQ